MSKREEAMAATVSTRPGPKSGGQNGPSAILTREELRSYYRKMTLIRRFEEEAARAYAQGKIGGFLHLYIGQEAIAVAAVAALQPTDYVFQSYRDHGTALACGMTSRAAMAELFGKDTGCSRGLGGSMHMFDVEHNFLGGYGIVGGHIPLAAGTAFKSKYKNDGRVTICFFGEGATNIAGFHEALSLAGLWKLPVVFVCENNEYAMGTPLGRTSATRDIANKAPGYGMQGDLFLGHDVLTVRERLRVAIDRARRGEGPTLVEIRTYRFRGHSISDPGKYRTPEELDERKKRDPILVVRRHMFETGFGDAELQQIDVEVEAEIQDCLKFAEESPPATEEQMFASLYV